MIRPVSLSFLFLSSFGLATAADARPPIVENGEPRAEIVIPEDPPRSTRLAAADLQTYLETISGARLPITFHPGDDASVSIYVGESAHTERLGLTAAGLEHGAYRIVSGEDWLALVGDDTDFVPTEPWAKNHGEIASGEIQAEWEEIVGEPWGVPNSRMYKHRERHVPGDIGLPPEAAADAPEHLAIWNYDERGSYNAVCGFLRRLGVRWYAPGEVGEVVPEMDTIPLPTVDERVEPDFPVRQFNVRWGTAGDPTMWWFMRLGIRQPYGLMIAHGMHTMTHTDAIRRDHPEWFALFGGERDTDPDERNNQLCYSNPELFEHTVRWARAQFDVYDFQTVSIMPPDGYIAICQCDRCEGEAVPAMGSRGKLSNHVWDFVNRVAKEVGKTHPDKKILCCAYGPYTDPPTNVDTLEPNVQVMIVGGRRPRKSLREQREPIRELRTGWREKTEGPMMIFENYPFTSRGWYLPAFTARTIGESIAATKGTSRGEDIWLSLSRDFATVDIAFNHFQVWFTARMYWGGTEREVATLLDEYCRRFYGPAAEEMKAFFDYCESNWQAMETDADKIDRALELFAAAEAKADTGTVYAERIGLIDTFLDDLRSKAELLSQERGPVPRLRTVWEPKEPIVVDGQLDDPYWRDCPTASTERLRELQTGRRPIFGTTVMSAWDRRGQNLYFAIRCEEESGEKPNVATTEDEDPSLWYGDAVEILIDTDAHRYYQVAVNPAGALVDLDRGADRSSWYRWESHAEVATRVADDHWTVEIRLPVTEDANDPLNRVVGRKPSVSLPWHINICRQRIRGNGEEYSALSPTGTAGFHAPRKFAHFYDGRSHDFEADPDVTDYLIESRKTESLWRDGKKEKALAAWIALAESSGLTDFQRADALAHAADYARRLDSPDRAEALGERIPLESVRKTVWMENALDRREWQGMVDRFGEENLDEWPFWQRGAGAFARGRARRFAEQGRQAEADFRLALGYTSDPRTRRKIRRALARNRERVLGDPEGALTAYRRIVESGATGGADYYSALQGAARILSEQGKFDEALAVLDGVEPAEIGGYWGGSLRLSRAEVLAEAGRQEEARALYREVAEDEGARRAHREEARERVGE